MATNLKDLSTQAKVAIGAGLAAVLAIGVGVAVWQPWNQADKPDPNPVVDQQEPVTPQAPEEKGLSVKVNSEEVPCALYEGTGWSVYVPEGWEMVPVDGENSAAFRSPDGAEMQVDFLPVDGGTGSFFSLSAVDETDRQLEFCDGSGEGSPLVTGRAPKNQWNRYEKLFTALAKTLTVGTEKPFAESYIIPREPDWQVTDGMTVLFQDKDGVILDDIARRAVEEYMLSWPEADREIYTSQYRINGIDWVASYTGLTDGYIDVFRVRAQYRVAADKLGEIQQAEGVTVADGWATLADRVHLVFNGEVTDPQVVIAPVTEDWTSFTARIK